MSTIRAGKPDKTDILRNILYNKKKQNEKRINWGSYFKLNSRHLAMSLYWSICTTLLSSKLTCAAHEYLSDPLLASKKKSFVLEAYKISGNCRQAVCDMLRALHICFMKLLLSFTIIVGGIRRYCLFKERLYRIWTSRTFYIIIHVRSVCVAHPPQLLTGWLCALSSFPSLFFSFFFLIEETVITIFTSRPSGTLF